MFANETVQEPTSGCATGSTSSIVVDACYAIRISARQGEEVGGLSGVDAPAGGELRSRVAYVVRSGPHAVES